MSSGIEKIIPTTSNIDASTNAKKAILILFTSVKISYKQAIYNFYSI